VDAVLSWFADNAAAIGVVIAAAPIVGAVVQFIAVRRAESRKHRFETFHNLIKQLVDRENPDVPKKLDRQIAIVFELRSFKHYFPVTLRILKGLKVDWADYGPEAKRSRLIEEIDLAIAYIEKKI
jgi:hypothetical protein